MPSASVSRPSASVLPISMVVPFIARSTSPGRMAAPEGMFSVAAIRPWTSTCGLSAGSARMMPSTAAAPDMSSFMRSMPSALLRSRPPESKVMPLPMTATFLRLRDGVHDRWMNLGGCSLPAATPRNAPMPSFLQSSRSSTCSLIPPALAISAATSARCVGCTSLAGALMRSRANHVASAKIWPRRAPSVASRR